ncbi:hypothetical protein LZG04_16210 [Saccharothrix sp. S26]|uniref:hypothetical protein n=1 Tax=Saccharothrix sp. S26 TaxID=2907215 RepID=UPI001F28C8B8|nr:hypothetical protein [Saccharothrix sp. S26]MCE6996329.1 hypothetical protein [Saccharothrix sp. S26]
MDDAMDLDRAIRVLAAWIRDTDSFTQVVARWLQSPVDYVLLSQERLEVSAEQVAALELRPGTTALHRRGLLRAALPGDPLVLADVRATVVEPRLTWSARQSLAQGDLPLGAVLGRYDVRRHTYAVTRTSEEDQYGSQVLRVKATLTTAGRLVAAVEETVYRRLLDHRGAVPVG